MGITFADKPLIEPVDLAETCENSDPPIPTNYWLGLANSYRHPLGREAGTGHLLMTYSDFAALDINTAYPLVFLDEQGNKQQIANLYIVKADAITPGHSDDAKTAMLVEVADVRSVLAMSLIDTAYNLRAYPGGSYQTVTLNSGSPWTWSQMVGDIWGKVLAQAFPGLPAGFAPDGTPDGFAYWAQSAWDALNDVLDRLGCAVLLDPTKGLFSIIQLGSNSAAQAQLEAQRIWDDYTSEGVPPRLPAFITVRFRKQPRPVDGSSEWYLISVPDATGGNAGAIVNTVKIVEDDLPAIYDCTSPPNLTNLAALTSRANQRAADWYRKAEKFNRRDRYVYTGIQTAAAKLLGPGFCEIGWEDRGEGYKTTILATPDNQIEKWREHVEFAPYAPQRLQEILFPCLDDGSMPVFLWLSHTTYTESYRSFVPCANIVLAPGCYLLLAEVFGQVTIDPGVDGITALAVYATLVNDTTGANLQTRLVAGASTASGDFSIQGNATISQYVTITTTTQFQIYAHWEADGTGPPSAEAAYIQLDKFHAVFPGQTCCSTISAAGSCSPGSGGSTGLSGGSAGSGGGGTASFNCGGTTYTINGTLFVTPAGSGSTPISYSSIDQIWFGGGYLLQASCSGTSLKMTLNVSGHGFVMFIYSGFPVTVTTSLGFTYTIST
jgi:hypothetical protein